MKNTVKNLINQVKKAIDNKASLPALTKAYVNNNGDVIARNLSDRDIIVFVGGIVEDIASREKLYSKDALTLAADTGVFKGGSELPENCVDLFKLPEDHFEFVVDISVEDFKAAAYTVSKDNSRPVLTAIHLNNKLSVIESVDGFRAYRKKIAYMNTSSLNAFELDNGLLIPGAAAAFGFKGKLAIYNGDKYIKLVDDCGVTVYTRKLDGHYINLEAIYNRNDYEKNKPIVTAKIKDIKTLASVLKTAISSRDKYDRRGIAIRTGKNCIEYYIESLEIFGRIEAETEATPEDYYIILNPKYLQDAIINQGGNIIELPKTMQAPAFCVNDNGVEALVLPIRADNNPFENVKAEAPEAPAEVTEAKPEAVADDTEELTPEAEAEAIARINEKQNKENRFVNVTAEDVKKEAEAIAAEKLEIVSNDPEVIPPEMVRAKAIYKKLLSVNFTPTALQEAETDIIFKANKEALTPIAKRAGGLYMDTLSIIAAIMAIYSDIEA